MIHRRAVGPGVGRAKACPGCGFRTLTCWVSTEYRAGNRPRFARVLGVKLQEWQSGATIAAASPSEESTRPEKGRRGSVRPGPAGCRRGSPARGVELETTSTLTTEEWERLCESLRLRASALGPTSLDGEFDPGSGLTLAACLIHASRARAHFPQGRWVPSGERVSSTWATCPLVGDNTEKSVLIPHVIVGGIFGEESSNAREGGPAAYQLVGGVTAYRGFDG